MSQAKVEVAFFICPHQDDWQLFMTPRALTDLRWPTDKCKIVFIYLTAGDAGRIADDGAGRNANEVEYWRGREMGSLNSLLAARGKDQDTDVRMSSELVCEHPIATCRMLDNTVSYYFRLPEDCLKARPSDPYAPPPKGFEYRPLGQTGGTIDSFKNWSDLVATLAQILRKESYGTEGRAASWVNYLDPRYTAHDNHTIVGKCIEEAMDSTRFDALPGKVDFNRETFVDYATSTFPANVTDADLTAKRNMFDTYVKVARTVSDNRYPDTRTLSPWVDWLQRQYTVAEAKQAGLLT